MLGPMANIARVPTGGRNFESTGEDRSFLRTGKAKDTLQVYNSSY